MRQSRYPDFHSRFDVPDAPASTSWWARVIFQLQRQWLLTFYPHPDSFAYPNRSRLLVVSFLILAGSLILGIYWAPFKYSFFPAYETVLALMAFMGFLFFLKIYFKILPIIKDVFLFPIVLWLSLPFYFFLDFLFLSGGKPTSEHLAIMLLIYTNLLHWRVAAVGIFLAYLLAFAVFHIFGGHFFILSEVNIIAIAGSVLVGLASSYTFGFADSKNFEQNARLLRIVSNRVQVALGVQLALSEALRHEANVSEEADLQRRLQEVAERLDVRANLTRAELQEMENEVSQTEFWGGTQLLEVSSLLRSVIIELERTYDYSAPQLKNQLRTHGDSKLVLQGEWGETVQMLASLFAMMLRPNVPALAGQQDLYLDVHWQALPGQVQVEMQRIGGRGTQYTLARGSAGRLKERSLHALAEQLLPAYSVYVLKRMGAELRLGHLEQGTPSWLLITWPAPELIQNRLTGNRRLSLMQMYENHLV